MRTYISWDSDIERDEKIIKSIPESSFECPKLNRGDLISLDVGKPMGRRILTPVKVSHVSVSISWDTAKNVKHAAITDAEQYLYIEPVVLESQPPV